MSFTDSEVGLDPELEAVRLGIVQTIPPRWYEPNPGLYWTDLLTSATLGWVSFVGTVYSKGGLRLLFFVVATLALYRAVLFIHELTHAGRGVRGFELAWNVVIGVPLLIPSFLYQGVHIDHHRPRTYGTDRDPEYLAFSHRSLLTLAFYGLAAVAFPLGAVVRFGLLAPLSSVNGRLRQLVERRYSALVINSKYVRHAKPDGHWRLQEGACAAMCWGVFAAWRLDIVSSSIIVCWGVTGALVSAINALRALTSHRYDNDGDEMTFARQLLDSCTMARREAVLRTPVVAAWQTVWAPLGLRYHALHHWIPGLPYHRLGEAHRYLLGNPTGQRLYAATFCNGAWTTLADLLGRVVHRRDVSVDR